MLCPYAANDQNRLTRARVVLYNAPTKLRQRVWKKLLSFDRAWGFGTHAFSVLSRWNV